MLEIIAWTIIEWDCYDIGPELEFLKQEIFLK